MKYPKNFIFIASILAPLLMLGILKTGNIASLERGISQHSVTVPIMTKATVRPSLYFEENQGQTDGQVSFLSRNNGYTLFLTKQEAVMLLRDSVPRNDGQTHPSSIEDHTLGMKFIGANDRAAIRGLEELPGKSNYFKGSDASRWRTNIPHFSKVKYEALYPGIDLIFYGRGERMEYDFVVAAGANPDDIQFDFKGADSVKRDNDGNLVMEMPGGRIVHHAPYAYQEINGIKQGVKSSYLLHQSKVSFQVAAYDTTRPLIIDPGLSYSSYLGGSGADEGKAIAVDGAGNFYVTGSSDSANFPVKNGLCPPVGGTGGDAFVTKFNSDGSLAFSTYFGSSGSFGDSGTGIAVDAGGKVYVTGYAHQGFSSCPTTFPETPGAYSFNTGNFDVFISILSNDGATLEYSSLFGGNFGDKAQGIAVDVAGDVYVAGITFSDSSDPEPFPIKNAAQPTSAALSSSASDAFVLKLSPQGNGSADLIYSTYLSGSLTDEAHGIAVDGSGNAYVTGYTSSTDLPVTAGVGGGLDGPTDAFVAKINSAGDGFLYFRYLGGAGDETGWGIAADGSGNAYVTGQSTSADFPAINSYDDSLDGASDAFVAKLDTSGTTVYASYLGGSGVEEGKGIAVDSSNNVYVTGYTGSSDFPTTSNLSNMSSTYIGGTYDAFVAKLNAAGTSILYSSFYGGGDSDQGNAIAVDSAGTTAYITGWTGSAAGFSLTATAAQQTPGGGSQDAFVARIGPFADLSIVINDNDPVNQGDVLIYTVTITNNGPDPATGIVLTVDLPAGVTYLGNTGCPLNGNTVTCNLSDLLSGASTSVQINVTLNTTSTITTTASVAANEADFPDNNSDSEQTTAAQPDTGTANDSDNTANPNDSSGPFITITNPGTSATSGGGGGGALNILVLLVGIIVFTLRKPFFRK